MRKIIAVIAIVLFASSCGLIHRVTGIENYYNCPTNAGSNYFYRMYTGQTQYKFLKAKAKEMRNEYKRTTR